MKYNKTELQLQGPPVEDLCKPHPFANGPNFEPTPAFDLQDRAGSIILHLLTVHDYKCLIRDMVIARRRCLMSPKKIRTRTLPTSYKVSAPQYGLALKTKFTVFESLPVMVTC